MEFAEYLGKTVCEQAGLTVLHGETPTDYQARVAALHARQDAAACFALLTMVIAQQKKALRWTRAAAVLAMIAAVGSCAGDARAAERSRTERAAFHRLNPCPSTGNPRGPCPGHQVDHVRSLCAGGIDHASNMAWITVDDHKRKTAQDVAICKAQRAGVLSR